MSEKLFNLDDESRIWDNRTPMTALDIVVMLNELSEENEQLRKELNDCEKFRYQVFKRMEELYNE